MLQWLQKNRLAVLLTACYVVMNLLIALRHEMFRDEAQAWLIARDLSLGQLFSQLQYEGHPCLWYLLLFPFAKLGLPVEIMAVLSLSLMGIAAWLLLTKAPFSNAAKTVCILSGAFVYYLPVISRSYALVPPLLMLTAVLYPDRQKKPVLYALALLMLSQTHVLLCGLVGMLMLFWALERLALLRKKQVSVGASWLALGIMLTGVCLLVALLPGATMNDSAMPMRGASDTSVIEVLKRAFFIFGDAQRTLNSLFLYEHGNWYYSILLLPLFGACVVFGWRCLRRAPKPTLAFLAAFAWQMFVYVFVYSYSMQRLLLLLWQFLFCAWLAMAEADQSTTIAHKSCQAPQGGWNLFTAMNVAVLSLALLTIPRIYTDVRFEVGVSGFYSRAGDVAHYIQTQLPADAVLIADSEAEAAPVAAYLPKGRVYNPLRQNFQNFSTWDGNRKDWCSFGDLDATIIALRAQGVSGPLYLLVTARNLESAESMSVRSHAQLTELGQNFLHSANENYYLFSIDE